jgi:hypothetical protein
LWLLEPDCQFVLSQVRASACRSKRGTHDLLVPWMYPHRPSSRPSVPARSLDRKIRYRKSRYREYNARPSETKRRQRGL